MPCLLHKFYPGLLNEAKSRIKGTIRVSLANIMEFEIRGMSFKVENCQNCVFNFQMPGTKRPANTNGQSRKTTNY